MTDTTHDVTPRMMHVRAVINVFIFCSHSPQGNIPSSKRPILTRPTFLFTLLIPQTTPWHIGRWSTIFCVPLNAQVGGLVHMVNPVKVASDDKLFFAVCSNGFLQSGILDGQKYLTPRRTSATHTMTRRECECGNVKCEFGFVKKPKAKLSSSKSISRSPCASILNS